MSNKISDYREIPLTQGKVAIVDAKDFECLNQFKWYAHKNVNTWYAVRKEPKSH